MATVYAAFGKAGPRGEFSNIQCILGAPTSSETITSGGSTVSAQSAEIDGVVLVLTDVPVWAKVGQDTTEEPLAVTAATGWPIAANVATPIGVKAGEKLAVMDI